MHSPTPLQHSRPGENRPSPGSTCRPTSGHPAGLGVAAALLTAGWYFLDRLFRPPNFYLAAGSTAFGLLILARSLRIPNRLRSIPLVLAIGGLALLWLASLDRVLVSIESRAPHLGIFARAVAPLIDRAGYPASADGGGLRVDHPDGLLTILPSFEKVGARPLAEFWALTLVLHIVLVRRRVLDLFAAGLLTLMVAAFVQFAVCTLLYLEHDQILAGQDRIESLSIFGEPAICALTLLTSGLAIDAIGRRLLRYEKREQIAPPALRPFGRSFVGFLGIGLLIGFAATFVPPGRMKAGRVLIDDRFCGVWEPTARLLDAGWYGDFSTYSFSSLAEWLGHWFAVDVNTTRIYTDELLCRYDILVLKTPVQPIAEAERKAIDRFVTSGGGLLLVGDHTNLLGMGTHLNSLCDKYGLRFRYDSVSDSTTGGFVDYFAPSVGRSVGAIHVDHLQFMTSCSIELGSRAEPIVTSSSCRRDPHDYANSSFFGRVGPHPEMAHGPTVLAATAPAGRGRIAAFTDSTVWSSFAVFQFEREKLAADLISLLLKLKARRRLAEGHPP